MFVEADADATLEDFGGKDQIRPPFPCMKELLFNVPGSDGILHSPVLLIQVTRLRCGGFILTYRVNHTMYDASGVVQFMMAVAEIARGASAPSILPLWRRELLTARNPPQVNTCVHLGYNLLGSEPQQIMNPFVGYDDHTSMIICRCFYFGPAEISSIRTNFLRRSSRKCSDFVVLTAFLWRCRTIALQIHPDQQVGILLAVNARSKFHNPP